MRDVYQPLSLHSLRLEPATREPRRQVFYFVVLAQAVAPDAEWIEVRRVYVFSVVGGTCQTEIARHTPSTHARTVS